MNPFYANNHFQHHPLPYRVGSWGIPTSYNPPPMYHSPRPVFPGLIRTHYFSPLRPSMTPNIPNSFASPRIRRARSTVIISARNSQHQKTLLKKFQLRRWFLKSRKIFWKDKEMLKKRLKEEMKFLKKRRS